MKHRHDSIVAIANTREPVPLSPQVTVHPLSLIARCCSNQLSDHSGDVAQLLVTQRMVGHR
jgi:hypothetical protein